MLRSGIFGFVNSIEESRAKNTTLLRQVRNVAQTVAFGLNDFVSDLVLSLAHPFGASPGLGQKTSSQARAARPESLRPQHVASGCQSTIPAVDRGLRAARSALSLAAPALMSSPRVRTPIRDHPLPLPAVFRPPPPSRGVRAGWRRDLRCSGPPRDRQRGDAVRVRSPGAGRHDLRGLPLADRKKRLARLLGKRRLGIVLSEHTDEDGVLIFRQACNIGLEGIVSKRLSAPYRSGPSREWIKVKNPDSPAMIRAREADW
jgi:hypothetical protein